MTGSKAAEKRRLKMQFGVCGSPDLASKAAIAAYDYMESTVDSLLKPREPDAVFLAGLKAFQNAALGYPVANSFIPGDLKITGPAVDPPSLRHYVVTTMQRAETAGVDLIVFGSGRARRVPEGFDSQIAYDQLVDFCAMAGPVAWDHGVTVAVEPLNANECNVLNSVDECARLVHRVSHPAIRLLVDAYHMMQDDDRTGSIVEQGSILAHAHVATIPKRLPPGAEPCDFLPFFHALKQAGYKGRVSIEGKITDPEHELPAALSLMRTLSQT